MNKEITSRADKNIKSLNVSLSNTFPCPRTMVIESFYTYVTFSTVVSVIIFTYIASTTVLNEWQLLKFY